MTITLTNLEFINLINQVRQSTAEDTIKAAWAVVGMSEEEARKIRLEVSLKKTDPYTYLPKPVILPKPKA